ncbi:EAL domain-containing protein [Pontibacterium granulatum]|uniref:bifunctional diguanylate cyclase/phosphodiesterase n=1 Tax=Pontibacterium granulatum TaxID=2036029 RepID=UPI00249C83C5|nr:EAL domain-containing protein [Pontibacterium granulatum]MDI3325955.1 EAL domain-containing protein [Pontibacterium granulatum]
MSLVKQLVAASFAVLIALLLGSAYLMSNSSKTMLLNQLQSHGQDAATHLGLYLAPAIAQNDIAAIETTVNAIFDSGFYQRIDISDNSGKILYSKTTPPRIDDDVPTWFTNLFQITPPQMTRDVTHQWSKIGSVHVQSRAGYAYAKLWHGIQNTLIWFGILAALSAVAIGALLTYILSPLKGVEAQALALSEKRFIEQSSIPGTRELKRVVTAMNQMVKQVRLMFDEQSRHIEDLRRTAYQDSLTGLPNQRAAEAQLTERLDYRQDFGNGTLLYLRITDLTRLNRDLGMEKASNYIKVVACKLEKLAQASDQSILGRLTGADFVLLLQRMDDDSLKRTVNQLCADLQANFEALSGSTVIERHWPIHIGLAHANDTTRCNPLLTEARLALSEAEEQDQNYVMYGSDEKALRDSTAWHQHVADSINNAQIFLQTLPLVCSKESPEPTQQELLARILDQKGTPCTAGEFLSVIKELGLMVMLDRAVIQRALEHARQHPNCGTLAINLSADAVRDKAFVNWFKTQVADSEHKHHLHVEVSESAILNNLSDVRHFREMMKANGMEFGVDNFGIHPAGFAYLYTLQPDYIKIDGSLIRKIDQHAEDRFFVSSLISIAHSLSIKAYAEHIERETQLNELNQLQIDGTQGWLHGRPKALEG